jgi:hypothetical protein
MKPNYRIFFITGALAGSVALSGCAGMPSGDRTTASANTNACIPNRGIRDYNSLDDQNLILYGIGRQAYHVVLSTPSMNLKSEFTIGVLDGGGAGSDGRICPFGGDAILIDGPLRERVPIRSIERIDDDRVEALRVEFGQIEAADESDVTVTEIQ